MITQQLILGLKNQQNQSRILSETTALPTIQQKIERLQCLESTEQSTDLIRSIMPRPSHSITTPMKSSYKRSKTPHQQPGSRSRPPSKGCGRFSHEGKTMARKDCPAINKYCGNCCIKGHFRAVCQKKLNNQKGPLQSKAVTEPLNTEEAENHELDNTSFAFATQDFRLAPNTIGQT